jgi:hypothetical protein
MNKSRTLQILFVGAAILALLLFIVRYFLGLQWHHLTPGPETTRITGPLLPDGRVDYIAAINQKYAVDPADNAAIPLIAAIGPERFVPDGRASLFLAGIKSPPIPEPPQPFQTFVDYLEKTLGKDLDRKQEGQQWESLDATKDGPWTAVDLPDVARWIAQIDPVLDKIAEATRRPRYFIPEIPGADGSLMQSILPQIGIYREIATAFVARATLHMGPPDTTISEQDFHAVVSDLVAVQRLGRLQMQAPSLIERLVGVAVLARGCDGCRALLNNKLLTTQQARILREEIEKLPPLPDMVECLDLYDRFALLDEVCLMALYGEDRPRGLSATLPAAPSVGPMSFGVLPAHFDEILRYINAWNDQIVAAARITDFQQRERQLLALDVRIKAESRRFSSSTLKYRRIESSLAEILTGKFKVFQVLTRLQEQLDLIDDGFRAVEAFSGNPPGEDTARTWANALPADRFTNTPVAIAVAERGLQVSSDGPAPPAGAAPRLIEVTVVLRK